MRTVLSTPRGTSHWTENVCETKPGAEVSQETDAPRTKNYSRWRAISLMCVYLLMGLHIAHWKIAGKTLAPLELNEVMYTLELGIVTAGFLFMLTAVVATAIFGRFFCSWGCHILALQDLCEWLLKRMHIRPKPVRSRVLLLVPVGAMIYMFIWPQVQRLIAGKPAPVLHLRSDVDGWASFVTTDFWRNLPGPWMAGITFLVCGFLIVYILGTRSFCRYACPYGAVFSLADRVAPGKITARGDCSNCGLCTAACSSNIRVHEELTVFGKVVSPSCLKDLDCVATCPENNIVYGFTRPSVFASLKSSAPRVRYDFSLAEDCLMVVVFVGGFLIFRGLYGSVPFLLALAIGGILAYVAVITLRLFNRENVRLNQFQLKLKGRLTRTGRTAAIPFVALGLFVAHSGLVRICEVRAAQSYDKVIEGFRTVQSMAGDARLTDAARQLNVLRSISLFPGEHLDWQLCTVLLLDERDAEALPLLEKLKAKHSAAAWELVADIHTRRNDLQYARHAYERALTEDARFLSARISLAELFMQIGDFASAAEHWTIAAEQQPNSANIRFNLGIALTQLQRRVEAIEQFRLAVSLAPNDADAHNNLGLLFFETGDTVEAERQLRIALEIDPWHANAHFNLGRVLDNLRQYEQAYQHFQYAARMDARYARLLDQATNSDATTQP